jgi:hypothetical protein
MVILLQTTPLGLTDLHSGQLSAILTSNAWRQCIFKKLVQYKDLRAHTKLTFLPDMTQVTDAAPQRPNGYLHATNATIYA